MGKGRYSIVFNSPTGNTKKLADTIYAVLAKENCDYFGAPKEGGLYSEMLYIKNEENVLYTRTLRFWNRFIS